MDNSMYLEFDALSQNELFARNAVAFFVLPLDPAMDELSDIKTAVSEAVTNCIVHAYKNTSGKIGIECNIHANRLHIKVSDKGCGIADVDKALQPFYTTEAGDERSGMGFTIMQTFMTDFKVESALGVGTTVTMSKTIGIGKKENA